jgi:hypothetical protein
MAGGETNAAMIIGYKFPVAVNYPGLMAVRGATAGYMDLAVDASAEIPEGYTYITNKDPNTGTADVTRMVSVHALIPGQKAELRLPDTHSAVSVGTQMMMTTAGCVVPYTSGAAFIIGTSEEGISQNTGGYVEVRINMWYKPS